jgi:tRNA(Ile)-lysidine synthase
MDVSSMARDEPGFSAPALHARLAPLAEGRRLWIAYSGGLDSSVLLHAAASLRGQLCCDLRAIHLDHGLHPQSPDWAAHCRAVCAELQVPLIECRLALRRNRGESLEAVARAERYRTFAGQLAPGDLLATAQHRDDQAETLLLALLRGSGVHGLAAMPVVAALGPGRLIRPLLWFSRAELDAYARRQSLRWIDDPSNADIGFDRNLLRQRVLPLLRLRWPAVDQTLARSAAHCAEAAELLDGLADTHLLGLAGSRPGTLSVDALRALSLAERRLVLRRWLARAGFRPPSSDNLRRIVDEVLPAAADRAPLVAWAGCEVRRYRQDLFALAPLPPKPSGDPIPWEGLAPLPLPHGLGRLELDTGASGPRGLQVCFRQPGLRCRVGDGPSRALKQVFQQAAIPGWLRTYVPLVLVDGQLGAVAGVAICDGRLAGLRWSGHPWQDLALLQS